MPDCGYVFGGPPVEERRRGVNRGKGRGVTKPPVRRRRKRR